jgi:hypothetical protein
MPPLLGFSHEVTLAGIGAALLGAGSLLSGLAALRRARTEGCRREDPKQAPDG